ncbi:MAG TPA: preprotein translocase subunit YajC [Planctomycetota bacterium]|nr:preprotein translocase subunit YajC [Planctomycetota bacterium]
MNFLLQTTPPPAGQAAPGFDPSFLILIGGMFLIMYFMVIRPQKKEQKRQEALRAALKKGDKVITSSGVVAEIHSVKDERDVVLRLSDRAEMTVLRSSIATVLGAEPPKTAAK